MSFKLTPKESVRILDLIEMHAGRIGGKYSMLPVTWREGLVIKAGRFGEKGGGVDVKIMVTIERVLTPESSEE